MRTSVASSVITVLMMLPAGSLRAQGESGLEFLTIPVGARAVALGSAYTGLAEGAEGLPFNPAAGAALKSAEFSFSVLRAPDLFTQSLVAFGAPIGTRVGLGFSINYQRLEAIPLTNLEGEQLGQFSPQTVTLSGTLAYRVSGRLRAGLTTKWFRSDLAGTGIAFLGSDFDGAASGVGFDVGLAYLPDDRNALQIGLAVLDLGPDVRFNRDPDDLPTRIRLGTAVRPLRAIGRAGPSGPVDLLLVADGVVRTNDSAIDAGSIGYGMELELARIVFLRIGVPPNPGGELESRPARYGLGIAYRTLRLDLARRFTEDPVLGQETHLSLNVSF